MKKLTSVILTLAMVLSILGVNVIMPIKAEATATINIGDYVQMGKYYDESVLWRCVDIDENGPLMLADKILSIKPYDVGGSNTANGSSHGRTYNSYQRMQYGSDYWADSNMRSWLNSTATAGNVQWLCGNPPTNNKVTFNSYANEKGFMADGNFTVSERNAIKTVTQKSLLNGYEYSSPRNSNYHTYNSSILSVVQNYATAYSKQVTDKMFLLDVKQVNKVYQNLGNYYMGQPTQKAVDNSDYKDGKLAISKNWNYYLRSPYADYINGYNVRSVTSDGSVLSGRADGYGVRCVYSGGYIIDWTAGGGTLGVRPAFYLNLSSAIFKSGTGAVATPYVATGGLTVQKPNGIEAFLEITSATVTGTSSTGFTANIDVNVGNNSSQMLWGKVVVALYDNVTNKLVTFNTIDCMIDSNNSIPINQTFEVGDSQYKVKTFWLDNFEAMNPLCKSAEEICLQGEYLQTAIIAKTIAKTIVNNYDVTSLQYAINDNGSVILSRGSGVYDKTEKRPITKDDMYGIASLSKMYVSAATMQLYDKGLIDIDKPITTYIPEFIMADERYKVMTPRMLMNHSSGLYGTIFSNTATFETADTSAHDTLLQKLSVQGLKANPGEIAEYCNDGFSLLEILVERVSGISYTEYISKNFSEPLGLTNTKTSQDNFDKLKLVKGYLPFYDGVLPSDMVNSIGSGGLYTTAEELCHFGEVLIGNKPEILSKESALLMQNEEYKKGIWVEDDGENLEAFGLGWDSVNVYPFSNYGIKVLYKSGDSVSTFHSAIVAIPEYNITMAVVASGGDSEINYAFAASVLQNLLLEKGIINQITPQKTLSNPVQVTMPEELKLLSGLYADSNSQSNIEVNDGKLVVSSDSDGGIVEYVYVGDNVFASEDGNVFAKLIQPNDGNTYLQYKRIINLPGVGQNVKVKLNSQRIEPITLSQTVLNAWNTRANKKYYLVNESPNSQFYLFPTVAVFGSDFSNGYVGGGTKIIDENHAVNAVKMRDSSDLSFFTHNSAEYALTSNGFIYISEDGIPEMTTETSNCIIGADGYAKYYSIGTSLQGKTMVVNIPLGAAYAVYAENGICINYTTVSKNNTTTLPPNGKILFIGKVGDTFEIVFQ